MIFHADVVFLKTLRLEIWRTFFNTLTRKCQNSLFSFQNLRIIAKILAYFSWDIIELFLSSQFVDSWIFFCYFKIRNWLSSGAYIVVTAANSLYTCVAQCIQFALKATIKKLQSLCSFLLAVSLSLLARRNLLFSK